MDLSNSGATRARSGWPWGIVLALAWAVPTATLAADLDLHRIAQGPTGELGDLGRQGGGIASAHDGLLRTRNGDRPPRLKPCPQLRKPGEGAMAPAPKTLAVTTSRTSPNTLETSVITLTIMPDFNNFADKVNSMF